MIAAKTIDTKVEHKCLNTGKYCSRSKTAKQCLFLVGVFPVLSSKCPPLPSSAVKKEVPFPS